MKQCEYKYPNDTRCAREVFGDDNLCILHSQDENKDPIVFRTVFEEEVKEQFEKNDFIYFDNILFPTFIFFGEILPTHIKKPISFGGSIFCGLADFSRIHFNNYCWLSDIEFRCSVSFRDVVFSSDLSFRFNVFKGTVCFLGTIFMGCVSFVETSFMELEEHNKCKEREISTYSWAQRMGEIFGSAEGFSFSEAIFEKDLYFFDVGFSGRCLDFSGSRIKGNFDFDVRFELDKLSLAGAEILGQSKIDIFERRSVLIDAENAYFNDERELFNKIKKKQWITLKFVLGEKTASRFPLIAREARDSWYLDAYKRERPKRYFLWNITSNCGRSLFRWSLLSLILILSFSTAYWGVGQAGFVHKADMSIFSYFYFSVVTITTLGFGDIAPSSLATQILVVLEVVIGYVMLGGLISIFSNKLARRS